MFTGIIAAVGKVVDIQTQGVDTRLQLDTGELSLADVALGDSICVSGVCLTATELTESGFWADVSGETLARTTLGRLSHNSIVNLEKSLTPSSSLGGHLVSGHVDGVGEVSQFYEDGRSWRLTISAPDQLAHYIAEKGSVCVDGVSLTVNAVAGSTFELNIIPHTMTATTIREYRIGYPVNLEVDIIARYLERLLHADQAGRDRLNEQLLGASGFIKSKEL